MRYLLLILLSTSLFFACTDQSTSASDANAVTDTANNSSESSDDIMAAPDWAKSANIYEVNVRNYTPEGTFKAFQQHLSRLKDMGVDILWLMPIHPISEAKRKAEDKLLTSEIEDEEERKKYLGSPYAVADYKATNPDMGTMEDFKNLLQAVHDKGMYLIIDWVPNHTGWDHPWITEHPEYYTQINGEITDPINYETGEPWGWTDVADLNYDNKDMQDAMIDAMQFWIKDVGIDGFRVDVAHGVPTTFWDKTCKALMETKRCFLLAEAAVPYLLNSGDFHMDYGWPFHHLMNEIAKGEKNANAIDDYLAEDKKTHTKGYHMHFTSNHDENAWAATELERMGDGHQTFAVLAATFDGMPLIYSGQEEPLKRKLHFFKQDPIEFSDYKYADFYRILLNLKKKNKALWNGDFGGKLERLATGNDENVYAFTREKDGDRVVVLLNLTGKVQDLTLEGTSFLGTYNNVFADSTYSLEENASIKLNPWGYLVLSNK